jgi:glucose/galactose transporter
MTYHSEAISVNKGKYSYISSITIIGILFFIFGFVTWLNGTLIPFLKISCELSNFQAYLVTFAFYISYFIMALPSSLLLRKTGFKKGIGWGLSVMALGTLIFIPAALSRNYLIFLIGLFIQGAGLALLQTASNPYITLLGSYESAAKRISIMGICNKFAGVLSPLILGAVVLKGASKIESEIAIATGQELEKLLNNLSQRVIMPYTIMAITLIGLTLLVRFAHLPEISKKYTVEDKTKSESNNKTSLWHFPHLIYGFIALFLYVGVEVLAGDSIALYGQSQGIALDIARKFTSVTLAGMVIGYIAGIFTIPRFLKQDQALLLSAVLGIIFTIAALFTNGLVSVLFIGLLGLANALIWPAIWPLSIAELGSFTESGSALLVMGIAGGATIPLIYGKLVDGIGNAKLAYIMIIPIYLYILFYAVKGHKIRR